ncbi:G protein alpha i subunit-like [Sycon ciliatum]|uniref:G protein alpha i subunit-like n=1 Tax=Sycon ciliatum TaxID=27933 RepID=UPI0020ACF42B|eukprot:scpid47043/ scgid18388/ Guanine nucleotide-binding protein G(t) subunit alpha-3; Gustducin alpha-3 chain
MGAASCFNTDPVSRTAARKSRALDKSIRGWGKEERRIIKLLLLGAGESGKSTIVKQMKIIHSTGFSDEDRLNFRKALHYNLVHSMRAIVEHMDILSIEYGNPLLERRVQEELFGDHVMYSDILNLHTLKFIESLWMDDGIQKCFRQSKHYHISDGAGYLFKCLRRFMVDSYVPTETDILHIRVRTTGIIQTDFRFENADFQLFDVGGQRSERRKWIHCFDGVTAIIFCASLSGYDTMCAEDGTTLRLHESLQLFDLICNSCYLQNSSMLLFLNKTDLLQQKVFTSALKDCFPEYSGQQTFEEVATYIQMKFVQLNKTRGDDQVFVHRTCATDTSIVKRVFQVAADTILRENLERIVA